MRRGLIVGMLGCLACTCLAMGQDPVRIDPISTQEKKGVKPSNNGPNDDAPPAEKVPEPQGPAGLQEALESNAREIKALKEEYARERERQQKQADLQQKQIEVLERTAQLLADQIKKQGPAAAEAVEEKTAVLEARSKQAAQRDQELANATNSLNAKIDAQARRAQLPYTAKELFLPTQTNETPLSIYGYVFDSYSKQNGQTGLFSSPGIAPWFLLQLNDRFLFQANFFVNNSGAFLSQGQVDWFITKWLTLDAGLFLTPVGFFNERLSPFWINKLPDVPIMFNQVVPLTTTPGLQLRGAKYLFGSPLKMEYSAWLGNGNQLTRRPSGLTPVADLNNLISGPIANTSKEYGGRLGFWLPRTGVNFGLSGLTNGIYSPGSQNHFYLWDIYANYHRGSWDFRTEYAQNFQEATSFINHDIDRRGFYAQLAYRNYNARHRFLQNFEGVFRYGFETFHGIDPFKLNQAAFSSPTSVPVDRNQYTFGINYYFYPSMVLKLAYEINRERGINLHDDIFLAQGVWAF